MQLELIFLLENMLWLFRKTETTKVLKSTAHSPQICVDSFYG